MPSGSVTPSGGAAFNGGTITKPLVINLADSHDDAPIQITLPAGFENNSASGDALRITAEDGTNIVRHDTYGNHVVSSPLGEGNSAFTVQSTDAAPSVQLTSSGAAVFGSGTAASITAPSGVSAGVITSGALPTVALVSGSFATISSTRDVFLVVPCTMNSTAIAAATVLVELSPDGTTYSTLATLTEPIGTALAGTVLMASLRVPKNWRVRLTATNATLGTGTYY